MAKNFRERHWSLFKNQQGDWTQVETSGDKRVTDAQGEFAIEQFSIVDPWVALPSGVQTAIDDAWTIYFAFLQSRRQ